MLILEARDDGQGGGVYDAIRVAGLLGIAINYYGVLVTSDSDPTEIMDKIYLTREVQEILVDTDE